VLEVVGQGKKDAQDKEGKTDDRDGKEVPRPVLPEVVQGVA